MSEAPTIHTILNDIKKDFKGNIKELKDDLTADIGELKAETNERRKDLYALTSQVGAAVTNMQNTRTTLMKHLDKHWQAYIALCVPIVVALIGLAGLYIRMNGHK